MQVSKLNKELLREEYKGNNTYMFMKYVNENSVLDYRLETVSTVVAERDLGFLSISPKNPPNCIFFCCYSVKDLI